MRIKRDRGRSWGFVSWLSLVIDFGYLRLNRHWWHNLHCRFPLVFRLHHGYWPTYWYWRHPERCEACETPEDRFVPHRHSCAAFPAPSSSPEGPTDAGAA